MSEFQTQFSENFQSATPKDFGAATITLEEFGTLRVMCEDAKKNLGEEASGEAIREKVIQEISETGWKQPSKMSASTLSESAIYHGCVVAEALLEQRGIDSAYKTYFSYTTKNQWDRFAYSRLQQLGKVSEGSKLKSEWFSLDKRDPVNPNPSVKYPELVDPNNIYGISKPLRYLPAQLMRNIEEMRLQSPENNKKYGIPWKEFGTVFEKSHSLKELATEIALYVVGEYQKRGIPKDEVATILLKGYDPEEHMKEHGYLKSIESLWSGILSRLENGSDFERDISNILSKTIQEKISEYSN